MIGGSERRTIEVLSTGTGRSRTAPAISLLRSRPGSDRSACCPAHSTHVRVLLHAEFVPARRNVRGRVKVTSIRPFFSVRSSMLPWSMGKLFPESDIASAA